MNSQKRLSSQANNGNHRLHSDCHINDSISQSENDGQNAITNGLNSQKRSSSQVDDKNENARPSRVRRCPDRYGNIVTERDGSIVSEDYIFNVQLLEYCYNVNTVPQSYSAAMKSDNRMKWQLAMEREYGSLLKYNTFVLVDRPKNHEVITGRWVYSLKNVLNPIDREKARWVAKGFLQKYGETFRDTFAPMSKLTTIRLLMLFCACFGFIAHQIDIETAFLNAELDYPIYMEQPQGFCKDKSKVCLLRKSIIFC